METIDFKTVITENIEVVGELLSGNMYTGMHRDELIVVSKF